MSTRLHPPGPKGRFLIGDLSEFRRDSLDFLADCAREYGDIVSLRLGPRRALFVNRPEYIESVLVTNTHIFTKAHTLPRSRFLLGDGLLTSDGDLWRRQRRLIQPAFHRAHIADYSRVMASYAQRTIESWQDGDIRDIHAEMVQLTLQVIAKTLFDADVLASAPEVGDAVKLLMQDFTVRSLSLLPIPLGIPTPHNREIVRAARGLERIIGSIIAQRRTSGEEHRDLLSMLLQAQDDDGQGMTDTQLRDEVMTLFLVGHDTTAIAIAWTWYLLAKNPEVDARLAGEAESVLGDRLPDMGDLPKLRYTESVVSESLRLYPPAWLVGRTAVAEGQIGDYTVAPGTMVFVSPWVMHHDPRYFESPEEFAPDRWSDGLARKLPRFAYFPFGGGPRLCVGHSFAMMEAVLVLAVIARQFRLSLVPGQKVTPETSLTLRPKAGIEMTLHKRAA